MTLRENYEQILVDSGLFPEQATKILDTVIKDEFTYGVKWNDDVDAYPFPMKASLLRLIFQVALERIDRSMPQAWYRQYFVDMLETA